MADNTLGGYDWPLVLIGVPGYEKDSNNQQVPTGTERMEILCKLDETYASEFYQAAQAGMKPELDFTIHRFEYAGQRMVEFEGQEYSVIRVGKGKTPEEIRLVCERKIADADKGG